MDYFRPLSIEEALGLAQQPGRLFLAGGTDLSLHMREGRINPLGLIDLGRIAELKEIRLEGEWLEIGSMTTFYDLGQSDLIRKQAKALWQACQTMGSPQIRHQATIGGNLGNCSPAADGLPPLLALGAEVELVSARGRERVLLADLLKRTPLLESGTLIKRFLIPLQGWDSGFAKLGRRQALAIARLSTAFALKRQDGVALEVRAAFGAVGRRAFLSEPLAQSLSGRVLNESWLEDAVKGSQKAVAEALGSRASAPYKRVAVGGVVRQALKTMLGGGNHDGD